MTAPKLPAEPMLECTTINLYKAGCNCLPQCEPRQIINGYHKLLCANTRELTSALARVAEMEGEIELSYAAHRLTVSHLSEANARAVAAEANDRRYRARRSHDWYEYDDYVTAVAPPSTDDCPVTRSSEGQFMEGYDQDSDMMAEDYLDDAAMVKS